jgi:hypothetical protein
MGPTPINVDAMRSALAEFRSAADERAAELKDSQSALEELIRLYQRLDDSERALANAVIAEWVASDDEKLRFDALAVIDRYVIGSAAKPLERLAERLGVMKTPGAPYELKKVERLLERLRNAC